MSSENFPFVSFIITSYNQEDVIGECLDSLPWDSVIEWEAIIVDDCSSDSTLDILKRYSRENRQLNVRSTETNCGGPSIPRNLGIEAAEGEYLFFVDGDDVLVPENFDQIVGYLRQVEADVLRLPMSIQVDSGAERVLERVALSAPSSTVEVIADCVTQQTMGVMAFSRRSIIQEARIQFPGDLKMGEDLVFMSEVIKLAHRVSYFDLPLYRYRKSTLAGASATTSLDTGLFAQAVRSWERVQTNYNEAGVDFLDLHGVGTVSYILQQLQNYYVAVDKDTFGDFVDFLDRWSESLETKKFSEPMREILEATKSKSYEEFKLKLRPRLLVAGHDLKFMKPALSELEQFFEIRVDEWSSERVHDEKKSGELLDWAQIIWVEWMTAASVWYSKNVRGSQKLIVRAHFYEITRDSGFDLVLQNVSGFVAIAVHTYEDIVEKFGFPRERVHLIPNFYDVSSYRQRDKHWNPFALALVGSVPRRKGLHRALQILRDLRSIDSRYTLSIFGKMPQDFGWVYGVSEERQYYEACDAFIEENELNDAIVYRGWSDMRTELKDFGCVLSTSDFEGSHVAPGEAFCSGIPMAVLNWRGAEYVYPNEFIFDTCDEIVEFVDGIQRSEKSVSDALARGRVFFEEYQDLPKFVDNVRKIFSSAKRAAEL